MLAISMSLLPQNLFSNPVWHALHGPHRHLALGGGLACRYPAEVAPFAALAEPSGAALEHLATLLLPGESVWIADAGELRARELQLEGTLPCLQMVLPADAPAPALIVPAAVAESAPQSATIVALGAAEAHEMVALTDVAFPGFFRKSTYRMGTYVGIRAAEGQLIAMAGERLKLSGYPEMSGICTHPAHRGRGLARQLIAHLAAFHRRQSLVSWLHVSASNSGAIALYHELGFETAGTLLLQRVSRAQ
jgi:ribosomal protein S18 acetylase RimI-like enzyme